MGLLDSILGSVTGGSTGPAALAPILGEILGGQSGGQSGLGGLIQRFTQAGHGDTANSWVGNGPNQPIEPGALQHVFGQDQVNQWSQQSGMAPHDLLGQLAQFLPAAINSMTPNGHVQDGGTGANGATPRPQDQGAAENNPFDGPGVP